MDDTEITVLAEQVGLSAPIAEVVAWAERLRPELAAGRDVYAYFRHDDDGSNGLAAERLRDLLAA